MAEKSFGESQGKSWESVHICPNCEFAINLADIDLRVITTGIISCPRCEWAGKVEIQIIDMGTRTPRIDKEK